MPDDNNVVKANNNSNAVGNISAGGDISGNIHVGNIGYSSEDVAKLLTQITSTFQPKPFDGTCPYKGLDVFEEEDAELFFGRERLVEELVRRVKESRTVFITGASGSGKSSLVRAGLVSVLKKGGIKDAKSSEWMYATMKPGREPLKALSTALSRLKMDIGDYFSKNTTDPDVLHKCAEALLSESSTQRFVLLLDQFEEIFTQVNNEEDRDNFLNLLTHAAEVENGRVIILFTMRSDFVPNCANYANLNDLLNKQFIQIGAMQTHELVSAIALPTLQVGLKIEPELIAQIINDMKGEPGALPLMQFALKDLFDAEQEKGKLTSLNLIDYLDRGGIQDALNRHADKTFNELNEKEKELARSIFSGLIEIGRGTQDTKRTARFEELIPTAADKTSVDAILQKLANARLVTLDKDKDSVTVTLSHEKLLSAWTWLRKLVDENRDVIAVQNEIINDAKEWDENKRDDSFLYRGARLANAREKLSANKLSLSGLGLEFVQAGEKAYIDALEQEKKRADHLEQLNRISLARQLSAKAQSILATRGAKELDAILLAIQSLKLFPTVEMMGLFLNSDFKIFTNRPAIHIASDFTSKKVAFSKDGKFIISIGNEIKYWNTTTGEEAPPNTDSEIIHVFDNRPGISPDLKYYAVRNGKNLHVKDLSTKKDIKVLSHENFIGPFAFSYDSKYIFTEEGTDHIANIWEIAGGTKLISINTESVVESGMGPAVGGIINTVAFSPNGNYVAAGGYDKRDYEDGRMPAEFNVHIWRIDKEVLPHGEHDNIIKTTAKEVLTLNKHNNVIKKAIFSPNSKYLATESKDKTTIIWDISSGTQINRITHSSLDVFTVFSPDSQYLISSSDGTTDIIDIAGEEIIIHTEDYNIKTAMFSYDSSYLAIVNSDKTIRVLSIPSGEEVTQIPHEGNIEFVSFSPNNELVIIGDTSGTLKIWSITNGKTEIKRVNEHVAIRGETEHAICSPDGKYAAFLSLDGEERKSTVCVQDIYTEKIVMEATTSEYLSSIHFSSDSNYVVANDNCWEINTGKNIPKDASSNILSDLFIPDADNLFSRDGKYEIRYYKNKVHVEEIVSERVINEMTFKNEVKSIIVTPDEKFLIIVEANKVHALIWRPEDIISITSRFIPRNLTRAEWDQYIGDALPYQAICENLPIEGEQKKKKTELAGKVKPIPKKKRN